ncbi:MAG: putative nucleotidyltransferase [Thermodesulfobacterium sp.]|uniref:Nucleotidyltransferase n=1 Tax=Candidatus Thermodesulfobacterium syntrophicum TaxID=3060442 RepID=A0AAE3TEA7_9BACT|nr:putative nucleotidyltransferase [Candidatus Thermodesulfobacterium syntrophicum]
MMVKEKWKKTKPLKFSTKEAVNKFLEIVSKDRKILVAYLFGSRAKETENLDSDIDFAIYTSIDFSFEDYLLLRSDLSLILKTDRFNLLWMNVADPIIKFAIIKEGKCIFHRDDEILNMFEMKIRKEFYDYCIRQKKRLKLIKNGIQRKHTS